MDVSESTESNGFKVIYKNFISKEQISELMTEFPRNQNGQINGSCPAFRKLHQEINNSPFPINNNGTPDMRCTKNPEILKLKLQKLLKSANN